MEIDKGFIATIIICAILIMASWYYRGELKDKEWEAKLRESPVTHHAWQTVTEQPLPEQKKEIRTKPKITAEHKLDADSIFNAGLAKGIDSLRTEFAYYTAPRDTSVIFDSVGILHYRSVPLERMDYFEFQPFPRKVVEHWSVDSIFVPTPEKDSWYEHWQTQVLVGGLVIIAVVK